MIKFSKREESMMLIFVTKYLAKLHKGSFKEWEIINLSEWMLWRIDREREYPTYWDCDKSCEGYLLRGIISMDEYVYHILYGRKGKRLHEIADEWDDMEQCGKYFGDCAGEN